MVVQNKLFTFIYIAGTALAIATTMIMAIVYYVKVAPIYPEVNRYQTSYITNSSFVQKTKNTTNQWAYSYQAVKEWFYTLKNVEEVSAEYQTSWGPTNDYIQPFDGSGDFLVSKKLIDPAFFRIYSFRFIEGKPFTDADLSSGICTAVITDGLARRIFGTGHGIVGKQIKLNYIDFRIVGVVEEPSRLTSKSFAHLYIPYSTESGYDASKSSNMPYYGAYCITLLTSSSEQETALRQELTDIVRRFNASDKEWNLVIGNQPISHVQSVFQPYSNNEFSWGDVFRHYFIIVMVLLLVPALNLSGMIAGRMESRLPEMGIRKSFGAYKRGLFGQVIWENLILTLVGGIIGLVVAWTALVVFRDWVFTLFEERPGMPVEGASVHVSNEMLMAPAVFFFALLLCIALNLLAALIPTWHSLRNPIIQSLNEKR